MVDTGDGTLRDLVQQNIDLNRISAIFFTHGTKDPVNKLHLSEEKARETGKLARLYIPIHLSSSENKLID